MLKINLNRFFYVALLGLFSYIGNLYAELSSSQNSEILKMTTLKMIKLTDDQLLSEQKALESDLSEITRLNNEHTKSSEARLSDLMEGYPLQFKSELAQIYSENDYLLLWENKKVNKAFLKEYAVFVASGISKNAGKKLKEIDKLSNIGGLIYDILLSDAFLDYMYYSKHVKDFAQDWLYESNRYISSSPSKSDILSWLNAIKSHNELAFIDSLSTKNSIYLDTLNKLIELSSAKVIENTSQLNKLALNLQRLRVIPEFRNGIFVNIPSYQLNYYRDGKLLLNSRVIVGKVARKTPVMYSRLSNVVVNPPWTPTEKLINEDIVPKIKKDPSYVDSHNYTIKDSSGKIIDPYSINWTEIKGKFPYRIRQAAGGSALGNYKFNMPSSDAIYLHDTPNHSLFSKKKRALSSGCVRVEKSDELATILLKESGWTESRKNSVLKSRKTSSANINSNNPVYLYYVTYWVDNGKINIAPDIYSYDNVVSKINTDWKLLQKYLN
ncbi:L,D-transpeptidase-like protein [Bisgaardia hudsonensis]|uniref:L,D-transpeptidase-like protein n=1 Tax=Bisgaardia hudsonensis TaxID=109472 RepID=A0A4R2N0S5_9PAST|nr:L,D-transpeptidase family protein [Bisgaardia hudsonensis]QLB13284.1 L,D-transpeptidase [Bisgaardia hudsonensis]TCP13135.1 L,D-transpeptidase-like protein [Bisgaardia hudsonensis]